MPSPTAQILPYILIPLFAWRIWMRARRSVGLQRLQRGSLVWRIVIFSLLMLGVGVATQGDQSLLLALVSGGIAGVVLAVIGLRLTRFSDTPAGVCYIPNAHIGIALTLIFTGRIIYRAARFYSAGESGPFRPAAFGHSPLTLFLFGLPAGYYIAYNVGILRHPRCQPVAAV